MNWIHDYFYTHTHTHTPHAERAYLVGPVHLKQCSGCRHEQIWLAVVQGSQGAHGCCCCHKQKHVSGRLAKLQTQTRSPDGRTLQCHGWELWGLGQWHLVEGSLALLVIHTSTHCKIASVSSPHTRYQCTPLIQQCPSACSGHELAGMLVACCQWPA